MTTDDIGSNAVADIYKLLPGKNCGEKSPCGMPKCRLFAVELIKGRKETFDCPYIEDDKLQSITMVLEDIFR